MAQRITNDKGFKIISMSTEEVQALGWGLDEGTVCMNCDNIIDKDKESIYIACLNDFMCRKCYEKWLSRAKRFFDDVPFEDRNLNYAEYTLKELGYEVK